MRFVAIVTSLILLTSVGTAWADRCIGPKDTSGTATDKGVGIIDPASIVFCDDFDTYCGANQTASVYWPGYPPNPDTTLCTDPTNGSEYWQKQHWSRPFASPPWGVGNTNTRMEGWDGNPGWMSAPYYPVDPGNDIVPGSSRFGAGYMVRDLNKLLGSYTISPIEHEFPGSNAVNGTDGPFLRPALGLRTSLGWRPDGGYIGALGCEVDHHSRLPPPP